VTSEGEARSRLAERQRERFDATHHCSAWILRDGSRRVNDAGEPAGSAGLPILSVIDGADLVDAMVVVTRYFGGTKLGVGGLVRAYGDAAAAALEAAPRRLGIPAVGFSIRYGYRHTAAVMRVLDRVGAAGIEHGVALGGEAGEVSFVLPAAEESRLIDWLRDGTSGELVPTRLGARLLYLPAPAGRGEDIA
jgi:putative IMPACT (imprinted ancient) family translation regulator